MYFFARLDRLHGAIVLAPITVIASERIAIVMIVLSSLCVIICRLILNSCSVARFCGKNDSSIIGKNDFSIIRNNSWINSASAVILIFGRSSPVSELLLEFV